MIKVYMSKTHDFFLDFGDGNVPEGFEHVFSATNVFWATVFPSALGLLEKRMDYETPGAVEYNRSKFVNFQEIGEHMAAFKLGRKISDMLKMVKAGEE